MNNQNKFNSGVLSSGDERKYEPINEEIEFEKPEKELNEIKGHLDRFDNVSLKEKIKRQMEDDKKNFSLNSRIPETGEFITARTNNPQSREFIDRFKGVSNFLNFNKNIFFI